MAPPSAADSTARPRRAPPAARAPVHVQRGAGEGRRATQRARLERVRDLRQGRIGQRRAEEGRRHRPRRRRRCRGRRPASAARSAAAAARTSMAVLGAVGGGVARQRDREARRARPPSTRSRCAWTTAALRTRHAEQRAGGRAEGDGRGLDAAHPRLDILTAPPRSVAPHTNASARTATDHSATAADPASPVRQRCPLEGERRSRCGGGPRSRPWPPARRSGSSAG